MRAALVYSFIAVALNLAACSSDRDPQCPLTTKATLVADPAALDRDFDVEVWGRYSVPVMPIPVMDNFHIELATPGKPGPSKVVAVWTKGASLDLGRSIDASVLDPITTAQIKSLEVLDQQTFRMVLSVSSRNPPGVYNLSVNFTPGNSLCKGAYNDVKLTMK